MDAKAKLQTAGKAIAMSQRIVFHFRRFFFSEFFMCGVFVGCGWFGSEEPRENA